VATGLIYTLRFWEGPPQWEVARAFYRGYRQLHPLSAEEIVAIPWLMRLHNAVVIIWWLGRDLDAGAFQNAPVRVDHMRQTAAGLERDMKVLRDLLDTQA
jgi:Ser/Thr protein kinase RdoA (MazF antagonist)